MRETFAHAKGPMIVAVIKERTPEEAIAKIKEGEALGARGFDLHIAQLDRQYWNVEDLKKIISSTKRPILSMNYNNGYDGPLGLTEEERVDSMILALEAGTSAIDVQGYTFDTSAKDGFVDDDFIPEGYEFLKDKRPKEVALKPEVIEKQKALIKKAHDMGAEVLGSMHYGTVLTKEELLKMAKFARAKGFDLVKMVAPCTDKHQVPEAIEAIIHLNENLDCPFSYHMSGKEGVVTRKIGAMFGSYIIFANVNYGKNADLEQLHLQSIVNTYHALGEL